MLKRLVDLLVAVAALLLLAPLLLLLAALIKLDSPGPVLFVQERAGRQGEPFRILKFRTMTHSIQAPGAQITAASDPRITRLGHTLRKWKLDELPQLVNVLRGEMSLVGPRPEVPRYVALYSEEQRKVLQLLPGMTDPASLAFRDESELLDGRSDAEAFYLEKVMPRKLDLNRRYQEEQNLLLDLKIVLATTVRVLLPGRGAFSSTRDSKKKVEGARGATQ
jgi:lipopolysaccharide/colanic/teichoic acid biosynthesis glycosyltransferase